jgi:hypothetical protein
MFYDDSHFQVTGVRLSDQKNRQRRTFYRRSRHYTRRLWVQHAGRQIGKTL